MNRVTCRDPDENPSQLPATGVVNNGWLTTMWRGARHCRTPSASLFRWMPIGTSPNLLGWLVVAGQGEIRIR